MPARRPQTRTGHRSERPSRGPAVPTIPPDVLDAALSAINGQGQPDGAVRSITRATGGRTSSAVRLTTAAGQFLLKWNDDPANGMFCAEERSLACLAATGVVRTPRTLAARDAVDGRAGFLLQEWLVPLSAEQFSRRGGRSLGEMIAALHSLTQLGPGGPPLDHYANSAALLDLWENRGGKEPERQEGAGAPREQYTAPDWATFYRVYLLRPRIDRAAALGLLDAATRDLLERFGERVPAWLGGGVSFRPSLLHGDLHRDNVLCDEQGEVVVIDPRPFVGEREMELCYAETYGYLAPAFFSAYAAVYPPLPDRVERRDLYVLLLGLEELARGVPGAANRVGGIVRLYLGRPGGPGGGAR